MHYKNDRLSFSHCFHGITPIKLSFQLTSIANEVLKEFVLISECTELQKINGDIHQVPSTAKPKPTSFASSKS